MTPLRVRYLISVVVGVHVFLCHIHVQIVTVGLEPPYSLARPKAAPAAFTVRLRSRSQKETHSHI